MLYLILLLPLALAALSLIRNDRARTVILAAGQVLLLALLIGACTLGDMATPVWHMTADLTFSLRLDGMGRFFCLLTAVCWLLTIPYASVYMTHEGHHPRFYAFLMLTEAAVLGAALAADLVTLYLFYELTTLLSFPLVLHTQRPKALLGAVKYLYYSVCGGFIALFGVVLLAQQSSLTFVRGGYFQTLSPTLLAASFLMLLGFGAKAGLYPLHNWLPSAHPVAPAPAHALLSGIIAKVGAIAAIRVIYFTVGAEALRGTWVQTVCIVLTLVTIFMGSFMGCTENGLKKRLAYSSISQISYVLLGVFLMTPVGLLGGFCSCCSTPWPRSVCSSPPAPSFPDGHGNHRRLPGSGPPDSRHHGLLRRPGSVPGGHPPLRRLLQQMVSGAGSPGRHVRPPVLYHSGGAADLGAFDGGLSVSAAVPRLLSGAGFPGPEPGPGAAAAGAVPGTVRRSQPDPGPAVRHHCPRDGAHHRVHSVRRCTI